jgi:hypothetical protein
MRRLEMNRFIGTSAVIVGITLLLLPVVASAESDSNRINQDREAIGRALIEVQAAEWPSVLPYYTDDIEYYDPIVSIQGIDMMAQFLGGLFGSTPDLVTTIEDETCINGIYTATWTMVGTFAEVPYSAKGMSIIKFRPKERQVYYQRDYYTEGDIMINIPGLAEPTEVFRTFYRCAVDPGFPCPLRQNLAEAFPTDEVTRAETSRFPTAFRLRQNVPNPFSPSTTISFEVPEGGGEVALQIYDVSGRLVRTLVKGYESPGTRAVTWNGRDDQGQPMPSGIYFCNLTAPQFSETVRMILLR